MIKSKEDLRLYLKEDAKRNGIDSWSKYYLRMLYGSENACAFRYIKCIRYLEYHLNNISNPIHRIQYYFYRIKLSRIGLRYNIQIAPNTCGYGLRLMHLSGGGGILLNIKKAGNYCGFNSGVLLGNVGSQDNRPTLGDYVAFGPGAKAFGKIFLGSNVFVAPNAVVTKDIPDNVIVAGIPAKIIKYQE